MSARVGAQVALGAAIWCAVPASAGAQATPDPDRVDLMPLEEEVELALSAAPEHLRAGAAVYALTADGYLKAQEGTNGFACIINRDHPLNRKPTCYDAAGAETILPKVMLIGELLLAGVPMAAIADTVRSGFESGRFVAPGRPGVAYMLSSGIRTYNPRTRTFGTFPPHLMFYAPNLTNAEVGASNDASSPPYIPFVAYQGPHGFMVVLVGDG